MAGGPEAPSLSVRHTVLVVDDESNLTRVVKDRLERELPVRVFEADSGPTALEILRSGQRVDLIISDQNMPNMIGTEFLAAASRLAPGVPRALLTARQDVGLAISALNELHIVAFFPKPLDMPPFVAAVNDILTRRRADELRERAFDHAARVGEHRVSKNAREPARPFTGPLGSDETER